MNNIKSILLTCLTGVLIIQNSISFSNASEKIENYSYTYEDYDTEIFDYESNNNLIYSEFIENGELIFLEVDENMNYVKLNNVYYTFDDYNAGLLKQAKDLYDNGISKTIVEEMESYNCITNIDNYINQLEIKNPTNLEIIPNNNSISPLASYGTFYYIGEYKKVNVAVSLASGAISVALGFLSGGLSGIFTTAAVKTFVSGFLVTVGLDYLTTTLYYKKWQAVLNSHGTTTERRQAGALRDDGKTKYWDTKKYDRTFETQRPS